MTKLRTWRNIDGNEEQWEFPAQNPFPPPPETEERTIPLVFPLKVICNKIGLGLLAVTAAIETIAYAALAFGCFLLQRLVDNDSIHRHYEFAAKSLDSSFFAMIWAARTSIQDYPRNRNIYTHESIARVAFDHHNLLPFHLARAEDTAFLNALRHHSQNSGFEGKVNAGANFIIQEVLQNASAGTISNFQDMDPGIILFIITKAVYIYTFGDRKNDVPPDFFKSTTNALILRERKQTTDEAVLQELHVLTATPLEFQTPPKTIAAQKAFNNLREIASMEIQKSLFVTNCWPRASEKLLQKPV